MAYDSICCTHKRQKRLTKVWERAQGFRMGRERWNKGLGRMTCTKASCIMYRCEALRRIGTPPPRTQRAQLALSS